MLVETKEEYLDYIKDVENLMDRRFKVQIQRQIRFSPSAVDEFAALRISMDKKEFNEKSMIVWKELLDGDGLRTFIYMAHKEW